MPRKVQRDFLGDDAIVAHLTETGRKRREKLREISSAQRPTERRNDLRPELRLIELPLDQLKPAPQRARKTTRAQVERLKRSIAHYGLVMPILVSANQEIVVGHAVAEAARELGLATIAAIAVDHLTPTQQRALAIALNRVGETGSWDFDQLKTTLEALEAEGEDLADTLFDDAELDGILHDDFDDAIGSEEPAEPPRPEAPVTLLGDVWDLGPHVVGCGDARDASYLAQLMGAETAQAAFVDPPYNVPIDGHVSGTGRHREFVMGSGEMSRDEFFRFLGESHMTLRTVMAPGAVVFSCMDWRGVHVLRAAAERAGFEILNLAVWAKSNAGMGSLYRSAHELILSNRAER